MGTCGDEEHEDWFFDAREEVSSVSDCNSEVSEDFSCRLDQETGDLDLWSKNPESVFSRRRRFFENMGFSFKRTLIDDSGDIVQSEETSVSSLSNSASDIINGSSDDYVNRVKNMELSRNESKSSGSVGEFHSDRSSVSSLSNSLAETPRSPFEDHVKSFKNIDGEIIFVRNESSHSSSMTEGLSEPGSSKSSSFGDFENISVIQRESYEGSTKKGTNGWLKKLSALTHVLDRHNYSSDRESVGSPLRRIARVQSYKKNFKELSALYIGQEFSAHDGSILTMKFSPDGKYLATGGEDCVVRVWEIAENERADSFEVPESDSSSYAYFRMNGLAQIEPLKGENEKIEKSRRLLKKSSDLTCVVLPPRVFVILETPLYEFRGHEGDILDLSWSEKGLLLSSSMDSTVRLWRVGSDECLKVFSHQNFVTCVAFNPVDDNYFISGSIDGKVRMWDVFHCRVIDYTDIRDIVTAVCYRPDAKGAVIGTMTGDCRFYHILDDELQLDREINLHGKKKGPSKRITGFQFFPGDADKVMVTSADSQIRILCGYDLICKLKASSLLTTLSPTSASFTSDGKHIVSTTEDSGVHVWNYSQPNKKISSQKPKTIRSCESFVSHNTSIAISWPVHGDKNSFSRFISDFDQRLAHFPSLDCFSQTRGSTTWPEEKLPGAGAAVSERINSRSKLKLLRSVCQNVCGSSPHLWGLVIVAATWDGKIRVFHNDGLPIRV